MGFLIPANSSRVRLAAGVSWLTVTERVPAGFRDGSGRGDIFVAARKTARAVAGHAFAAEVAGDAWFVWRAAIIFAVQEESVEEGEEEE